ncbi:hypothetical protein niasHS_002393 [Heterodera schachtii]|uniref:G-protein coupled receptors family 1 profile domain-containing protein n=1 Tax=Heterodera schachtii TaxID=97005 RepID=A0ABD2KJU2_HETSC
MFLLISPSPSPPSANAVPSDEMSLDNAFELDERGEIARPEMLLTDWVELVLLAVLLLLGLPLNIVALAKQLGGRSSLFNPRKTSRVSRQEVTRTNFLWLKLHLTVVDLLVIACYCPSHIAWLIGYTWSAGTFLCKAMQYSWDFCFHLMSFGVVSIALDRLRTVYGLMRMERTGRISRPSQQMLFVRRLIIWCYLGAALVSLPQWFVWTTIDLKDWSQCTTIWHKLRVLEFLDRKESTESFIGERLYTAVHLATVFWLPFVVILAAYVYIVLFLFFYSLRPLSSRRFSSPSSASFCSHPSTLSPRLCPSADNPSRSEQRNKNKGKSNRKLLDKSRRMRLLLAPLKDTTAECRSWPTSALSLSPAGTSASFCAIEATSVGGSAATDASFPQHGSAQCNFCPNSYSSPHSNSVPAWRLEMRSRIFRTTVHVISAYLICWLPYNILALATFFSKQLQITISVHLELLRICVLLNALLNPFIYGFKQGHS